MSYLSMPSRKQNLTTSLQPGVVNIAKSNEHTAGQAGNTRFISGSIFSGLAFAAIMAFMNLGSPTTTNQSNMTNSQSQVTPFSIRNKKDEVETEASTNDNVIKLSQSLQKHFGFNTAQWSKILKVERKTIYNWKNNSDTKVRADTAKRILTLSDFAKTFKIDHAMFFSKFIYGGKSNNALSLALHREALELDEIMDAYYEIYTEIDGAVKRKKLMS
ncbi:hypothetical protein GJV08_11775 [Enterobacteriaceae bacterium RIT692]|nr:hypothetical protein [Enterobacteriaceae bacterium RIT692]